MDNKHAANTIRNRTAKRIALQNKTPDTNIELRLLHEIVSEEGNIPKLQIQHVFAHEENNKNHSKTIKQIASQCTSRSIMKNCRELPEQKN